MFYLWTYFLRSRFLKRKAVHKSNNQDICMKRWRFQTHEYLSRAHIAEPHQAHPASPSAKPWVAAEDGHISWAAQQKLQAALKTDLLWNRIINVILPDFKEADLRSFLNARWKKKNPNNKNRQKAKNQYPASWRPQSWCSTQNVLYNKDSQCSLQAECWPVVPITGKSGTSEPPSVLRGEI